MDIQGMDDAFERVAKKQKMTYMKTNEVIEKLLENIRQAEQLAGSSPATVGEVLGVLQAEVNELGPQGQIAGAQKELAGALSKCGKLLDKSFTMDVSKACRNTFKSCQEEDLRQDLLNEVIAQHLFREGHFELGETFLQEAGIAIPDNMRQPFLEMYQILELIRQHNLEPALEWARAHRPALRARHRSDFEFRLHQLHFVHLLHARGRPPALLYARAHFGPFAGAHMADIQRLMGCLLWVGKLPASPYADLLAESRWDAVAAEFRRECCRELGQSLESPLKVTVAAGAQALPTLLKWATLLAESKLDLNVGKHLPVEIELGRELQFHSIFACPVSREQSTAENPPMLLPCGHVLCKGSIQKLAKGNSRAFKCPYCPHEATVGQCKQVHL